MNLSAISSSTQLNETASLESLHLLDENFLSTDPSTDVPTMSPEDTAHTEYQNMNETAIGRHGN